MGTSCCLRVRLQLWLWDFDQLVAVVRVAADEPPRPSLLPVALAVPPAVPFALALASPPVWRSCSSLLVLPVRESVEVVPSVCVGDEVVSVFQLSVWVVPSLSEPPLSAL